MPSTTQPSHFQLQAPYQPTGDQPQAIEQLYQGLLQNHEAQTLLGVTGSGKTFTLACLIERIQRPTLIISHNKTLAAQLHSEFQAFFPNNAVEYFVSYYDYYQPEAYIPSRGIYIEKDLKINSEIERLRLKAASSLLSGRKDVIVIASVSCIYGMSNPSEFKQNLLELQVGTQMDVQQVLERLVQMLYRRNDADFESGDFRLRGDTLDLFLPYADYGYRLYYDDDVLERIDRINPKTGYTYQLEREIVIFPANLFVTSKATIEQAIHTINKDLSQQANFFKMQGKDEEAERLEHRVALDMEMLTELGYCNGIENYTRYFDGRNPGDRPYCLIDYFPKDYLTIIDESHVTLPQIRAMFGGDYARKKHLVEYGFRLPAAMDNRPLTFGEFRDITGQTIFVSATPAAYEIEASQGFIVEQIVRPTGLLDPTVEVHPTQGQIDHLLKEIQTTILQGNRVLITTLTKRMAEELTSYLVNLEVKARYVHADIKTLERVAILEELRQGIINVLVGVNLLREGLDLPEVALVAILDADKEGLLRNSWSLIQTMGRAARNIAGRVILYADGWTDSMKDAVGETRRRRTIQEEYNKQHGITPKPVYKASGSVNIGQTSGYKIAVDAVNDLSEPDLAPLDQKGLIKLCKEKETAMKKASAEMDYAKAIALRDELNLIRKAIDERL